MSENKLPRQPCPCLYNCSRHDHCDECIAFHRRIGTPVACMAGLKSEETPEDKGNGRVLTLADKPHLTDYAACAG
jgi:hypothetical protein